MRRYTDAEVSEIFRRAAAEPPSSPHAAEGFTLAELEAIGSEVGLPAERIAAAARSLDRQEPAEPETLLGLPIAVHHAVVLDRRLGDDEWDQLVVAARDTFAARGRIRDDGAFRQWTNSNLQVLLEPHGTGHRLRFRTLNGHARRMIFAGLAVLGVTVALAASVLLTRLPEQTDRLESIAILGLVGAALLTRGIWGLRRWAARRQAQFRELATTVTGDG